MRDNKLIAEFMGVDQVDIDTWLETNSNLKYHTSWDWLMPVVEKIESLGYSYDRINADVFINNQNGENVIPNPMDENTMTMIEKTYYVVGEFIKQYNRTDGRIL